MSLIYVKASRLWAFSDLEGVTESKIAIETDQSGFIKHFMFSITMHDIAHRSQVEKRKEKEKGKKSLLVRWRLDLEPWKKKVCGKERGRWVYARSDSILDPWRDDLSILVERRVKNVFIFFRNDKILLLGIKSYQLMLELTKICIELFHHLFWLSWQI